MKKQAKIKKRAGFYTCSVEGHCHKFADTVCYPGAKVLLFFDIRKFLRQKKSLAPVQLRWTKNLPSFEAWEAR